MAEATIVPEREIVIPAQVTLTMDLAEAMTLRYILRRVGGSPDKSARKHADAIREALGTAGVYVSDDDKTRAAIGAIRFEDIEIDD